VELAGKKETSDSGKKAAGLNQVKEGAGNQTASRKKRGEGPPERGRNPLTCHKSVSSNTGGLAVRLTMNNKEARKNEEK